MKKLILFIFISSCLLISRSFALSISNISITQGDTAKIDISNFKKGEVLKSVKVGNLDIYFTKNLTDKNYHALYGAGLNISPGEYQIKVKTNLKTYISKLNISKKEIPVESFSFATSTTGTSTEEQNNFLKQYLKTLETENKILGKAWSNKNIILKSEFMRPLKESIVTDIYGYSRNMGTGSLITHKGTDYRAATGTPVYAINKGVVRLVQSFSIYGNTVIIDHGNGLLSMYMHLDKATAKQGYLINKGDEVGLAGGTGNVTGPHLHLTIKLNGQSVDPEKFFEAVGVK